VVMSGSLGRHYSWLFPEAEMIQNAPLWPYTPTRATIIHTIVYVYPVD